MRKFYLFKLGFLTSTLCNCGLQEAEFQIQNEIYGKNFKKSLKDLSTCLQNVSHKNRQEQNAIKSNQTTLTGDIAELAKKFESRIKEKENAINTLQEQLIKQSEDLADLKKQKDQLEKLETELKGKVDKTALDEEIQKHTKELIEKENEINTLNTQLAQQNKTLAELKEQKDQLEKLENEFKAKGNDIEGLKQEIDDLKKQKEELNDRYTETKQKLEKQNLGINRIGEYLTNKQNKQNKQQFTQDWKSWTETNIRSPKK